MSKSLELNSYAAMALTQEQAFRPANTDSYIQSAGKFSAGMAITILAVVETALSALATFAALPVSYFVPERYAAIKTHTADSATTIMLAAKRTFGAEIGKAKTEAPQVEPSRVQKLKELVQAKARAALQFGKENQKNLIAAAIAAAITATVLSAFYSGLFSKAFSPISQTNPFKAKIIGDYVAPKAKSLAELKATTPIVDPKMVPAATIFGILAIVPASAPFGKMGLAGICGVISARALAHL